MRNITERYTIEYSKYFDWLYIFIYFDLWLYIFYTWPKFWALPIWTESLWKRTGTICTVIDLLFRQFTLPLIRFLASKELQGWNNGLFDRGSWSWPMRGVKKNRENGDGNNWDNVVQWTSFLIYTGEGWIPLLSTLLHFYYSISSFQMFWRSIVTVTD